MNSIPYSGFITKPNFAAVVVDLRQFALLPIVIQDNWHYYLKREFHVTLIGSGHRIAEKFAAQHSLSLEEAERLTVEFMKTAAEGLSFTVHILDSFLSVSKFYEDERVTRKSVIVRVIVTNSDIFYAKLENLMGLDIRGVPEHITLYTTGNTERERQGIGLITEEELQKHARPLEFPVPISSHFGF